MKSKGKTAWLITWEGEESEYFGRCKIATILPANHGDESVILLLRVLYYSDGTWPLGEKAVPKVSIHKDNYFRKTYRDVNTEYLYGEYWKQYLRARKVENLLWEESSTDQFETTLYWTELPKFRPNPKYGELGSPDAPDSLIQDRPEKEMSYTYSTRAIIEQAVARKAELDRLRRESTQ